MENVIKFVLSYLGLFPCLRKPGLESGDMVFCFHGHLSWVIICSSGMEEGELGAVYRGEGEHLESLVSILYLAIVLECSTTSPQRERIFFCKGNLAAPSLILKV